VKNGGWGGGENGGGGDGELSDQGRLSGSPGLNPP